ncbi:MAG TPA: murein L,D-transpeptidase [Aliiroseovarius sp.]|nr:murein L,D-transpeptidase [Aliiroseovarius sp.]
MKAKTHAGFWVALVTIIVVLLGAVSAQARSQTSIPAFAQAVAEAAALDEDIAAFYRENGYKPIWTSNSSKDRKRRAALLKALASAGDHGLPVSAYNMDILRTNLRSVDSPRQLGQLEVEMSRLFLLYARHVQTGILNPRRVDSGIVREVPLRGRTALLAAFAKSSASGFLKSLPPKSAEYARLMKEKLRLEKLLGNGGWGQAVPVSSLQPGASGNAVVILRNRLMAMGYLSRSSTQTYDSDIQRAVQLFQVDHGLNPDGVAGAATMREINTPVAERLQSILVTMERERWMNIDRGSRHIWVNLTDFRATIVDNGQVTFETRAVVGKNTSDRRTPEFSDIMEFMVINPSWNVPRSITTKEYLPAMQRNANAVGHLQLIDSRGRVVNRSNVNFNAYTARTFPYAMRQPPSSNNALGLVKFMFPNRYNIYLHDTPAKNLFARDVRAFSHGCIRLQKPFEFAYMLLARQTNDPQGVFHRALESGRETRIDLENPVPVHLVYRTAVAPAKGNVQYREDVYGRDGRIWSALANAGVVLRAVGG